MDLQEAIIQVVEEWREKRGMTKIQVGMAIFPASPEPRVAGDKWNHIVKGRNTTNKKRHLAAGTLAFDPVHDLGKLSAVEDEGKAPIPGVDTLPTLWVGSLCIHECPLLDVLPSALLPQYRGRFVFGRGGGIDCLRLCYAARRLVKGGLGGGRLHEPLIALGAGIFERLCDAGEELPVRVPVVVLDAGSVLPSASKVLDLKKFILFLTVTDRLRI